MSSNSLITPEIEASIRQLNIAFKPSEPIGTGDIKRYAFATNDLNPLYIDEEYARKSQLGGLIAPPDFVFDINFDILGELAEDGRPKNRPALPPPLTRIVRMSQEYEYGVPVRPGDVVHQKRKVTSFAEKETRIGKGIIVSYEDTFTNDKGEMLGINRETLLFVPPAER